MLLGERVKYLRDKAGLKKQELASLAGVSRSLIGKLEEGITDNPKLENLQGIALALGVSVAYLIGEGYPVPENLRRLALQNGIPYKELDNLVRMIIEDKESVTIEEWRHILHSSKEYPELYMRLGKVKEEERHNHEAPSR